MNILDKTDKSLAPIPNRKGQCQSIPKLVKFKWTTGGERGTFQLISKHSLSIDGRYQRGQVSEAKVKTIASEWDWLILGAISVVMREDGSYWVFDGGHRVRASFYRHDIDDLPCMVHKVDSLTSEAKAFVARNTMVSNVSSIARFTASLCAEEPSAVDVHRILSDLEIEVSHSPSNHRHIKAIGEVCKSAAIDCDLTKRVLATCVSISDESGISVSAFRGLFTLCRTFHPIDMLDRFESELSAMSQKEMLVKMRQLKALTGQGGSTVEAKAILEMLNKHKKNKLTWPNSK